MSFWKMTLAVASGILLASAVTLGVWVLGIAALILR